MDSTSTTWDSLSQAERGQVLPRQSLVSPLSCRVMGKGDKP